MLVSMISQRGDLTAIRNRLGLDFRFNQLFEMSAGFISMGGFSSRTSFQDIKQKDTKYKVHVVHFYPSPSVQGWVLSVTQRSQLVNNVGLNEFLTKSTAQISIK